MTPDQATALATRIAEARFPTAATVFVAGSIIRGEGTTLSDLDLVVLHPRLERAWRESFLFEGTPVEAFVHDPETLNWFFRSDVEAARPALIGMVAEGRIVGPRPDLGRDWQLRARDILARGPPPASPEKLNRLRYEITDKIDDLRGDRSAEEMIAIGAALYSPLAELLLRNRGGWLGAAKWIPRLLRQSDPLLASRFTAAFQMLYCEMETHEIMALADVALAPHGGRLFDGDHRLASAAARLAVNDSASRHAE
jgi:hypothetical protein